MIKTVILSLLILTFGITMCMPSSSWVVIKSDNICGIANVHKISNPAVVEYRTLLHDTSQYKYIVKNGINPDSTQGKLLLSKAHTEIVKACENERQSGGYCGVWKKISHVDGRLIADITIQTRKHIK
jgi:hypothetical protein